MKNSLYNVELWNDWFDCVYDDFIRVAELIGFDVSPRDIQFTGFWSQGDGASFTGSYSYAKGSARRIREYAPQDSELHAIADELAALQKRNFYQLAASITRCGRRYVHENTIHAGSVWRDSDNYQDATSDAESIVTDCARRLCQWLYSQLHSAYEYETAWQAGREARFRAETMREAGREWVAACRATRHVSAEAIEWAEKQADRALSEYESARETFHAAIKETRADSVAREAYQEGV